jgi:general secretion pathway protein J
MVSRLRRLRERLRPVTRDESSRAAAGFTILELVIAMTVLALVSLALYGVVALGAQAAGTGERKTEQARRFRTATGVLLRQLRSAAPMYVSYDEEEDPEPYFVGEKEEIEFVTAAPQGPYAAGLALVRYWLEDGTLKMSETPYFLAYDEEGLDEDAEQLTLEAVLLYDVADVAFEFQRTKYDTDEWETEWDASDEETLPAAVRITVEPETPDGPALSYEVPVYVGVYNEITGEDDFRLRRQRAPRAARRGDDGDDGDDQDDGDSGDGGDDGTDGDDEDEDFDEDDEDFDEE